MVMSGRPQDTEAAIAEALELVTLGETDGDVGAIRRAQHLLGEVAAVLLPGTLQHTSVLSNLGGALIRDFDMTGDVEALMRAISIYRQVVESTAADDPRLAGRVYNLADSLRSWSDVTASREAMAEAVRFYREASSATPPAHPDEPGHLSALGRALARKFDQTGDSNDLDESITIQRKALASAVSADPHAPIIIGSLVASLTRRASLPGRAADLEEAISILRDSLANSVSSDTSWPMYLSQLGQVLMRKSTESADNGILDEAVDLLRQAVSQSGLGDPNRASYLYGLSAALRRRCNLTGALADSEEALAAIRQAVRLASPADPNRRAYSGQLASILMDHFGRGDGPGVLDEAITAYEEAVAYEPVARVDRSVVRCELGDAYTARFELTAETADLADAIAAYRGAAAEALDGAMRAICLSRLGDALFSQFTACQEADVLDEAIATHRLAVCAAPPGDPNTASLQLRLGTALARHAEITGVPDELDEVINVLQSAIEKARGNPALSQSLYHLSRALIRRFEHDGNHAALEEAFTASERALAVTAADDTNLAGFLFNHGEILLKKFQTLGEGLLLDHAINSYERSAQKAWSTADREAALASLGIAWSRRFDRTGSRTDLDLAIAKLRAAIDVGPDSRPTRYALTSYHLGNALARQFDMTGDADSLEQALFFLREAITGSRQEGDPSRSGQLVSLGGRLMDKFDRFRSTEALEEAQHAFQAAAENAPDDESRAWILNRLAGALLAQFEFSGQHSVLEEAIRIHREVVAIASEHDPSRATYLSNLGNALMREFENSGQQDALDECLRTHRQAIKATDPEDREKAIRLSNYGNALVLAYIRFALPQALAEAIEVHREAVRLDRPDYPHMAKRQFNFASALMNDYRRTGLAAAMDEAIDALRGAVAATSRGQVEEPRYLAILGQALREKFELTGDRDALIEAISKARAAIEACPPSHHDRAKFIGALGQVLQLFSEHAHDPGAAREACENFAKAARLETAPVSDRLRSSWQWGQAAMQASDHEDALTAFELGVALLPRVVPLYALNSDREHWLGEFSGLAAAAAAAAIAAGQSSRAVELLEQARGIMLSDALDARSDLTVLRERRPDLAADVDRVRQSADAHEENPSATWQHSLSSGSDSEEHVAVGMALRRRQLQEEWDSILARIRAEAGFSDFLRPPSISRLARQSSHGPIVIIYTSPWRSDALVLSGTSSSGQPVEVIELPGVTQPGVLESVRRFETALNNVFSSTTISDIFRAQREINGILEWLWDAVVEPVVNFLDFEPRRSENEPLPRVWWCPVGLMARLPLHAAGYHAEDRSVSTPRTLMDLAASSYTATIRLLEHARQQHLAIEGPVTPLIVTMPETADAAPLDGVSKEADLIRRIVGSAVVISGAQATSDTVRTLLMQHPVTHFACHGVTDWESPSKSQLLLHDYRSSPFDVTSVSRLRLKNAALAYLSACSTSQVVPRLADEAVHITAAFQIAGYQQVIGTLWPVDDRMAVRVAQQFYDVLASHGSPWLHLEGAAHALHRAACRIRDDYRESPTAWAAHIHVGA
jgi:tetratricopeptide (TPR) repeat protein